MDGQRRIALVETRTVGTAPSPAQLIRYQLSNHLQSATLELYDRGQIISYEEYYPYGSTSYQAVRNQTETPKRYRYTRKERDEETGLYYHGARYYAAWLGRWTAADPKGMVDGVNVYGYVRGKPIRLIDPMGQWGIDVSSTARIPAAAVPTDNSGVPETKPGNAKPSQSAGAKAVAGKSGTEKLSVALVQRILQNSLRQSKHGDLAKYIQIQDGRLTFIRPDDPKIDVPKFWDYLVKLSADQVGAIIDTGTLTWEKDGKPKVLTLSNNSPYDMSALQAEQDFVGRTIYTEQLDNQVHGAVTNAKGEVIRNQLYTTGAAPIAVVITNAQAGQKVNYAGFTNAIIHELVLHIARALLGEPASHLYTKAPGDKELKPNPAEEERQAVRAGVRPIAAVEREIDEYFVDPLK